MKVLCGLALFSCSFLHAGQNERTRFQDLSTRAAAARDSNDSAGAVTLYREALQLNQRWEEGWWFLGTLLYDGDHFAEGRDALRRFVALQPNAAAALQILGLCEFETGEYAQALEHIRHGMASAAPAAQMEAVVRFHQAMLLTRAAQFDKALAEYVWFAQKGIHNSELMAAIGLAGLRTPLLPSEIAAGKRDLFEGAGKAAYLSLAGDLPSARTALIELVRAYGDAHYVHYLYGCFLLGSEPDVAMDELRRELALTPGSGAANAMLAWTLLQRGDASAALPYARAAAEHEANASLAQYVYGRALLERGEVNGAVGHLQSAESLDPSNLETHVSLATAYSKAGNPAEARRERQQSLALWEGKSAGATP